MKGAGSIILTMEPRGVFHEGYLTGTPKPGTIMQIVAGTAMDGTGRFTWQAYDKTADGDRSMIAILLADGLQGKLYTSAYASGDRARYYVPAPGEEFNLLKGDVSGTADDFAVGDQLMVDDGTGKLIAATGSPQTTPFTCLEAIVDPTADQLVWVMFNGF